MNLRTNLKINGAPLQRCVAACATCGARLTLVGLAVTVGAAAGCRGRGAAAADAATPATRPALHAAAFTLAQGTPPGGLRDWIRDVRRGLAPIPEQAVGDWSSAQRAALELYLTRQEYIEMYWGSDGKLTRGATLGPAVKEAETRFHEVLQQMLPGNVVRPAVMREGIDSLSVQYDRVIEAAERAGVPLDPHVLVPAASHPEAGGR